MAIWVETIPCAHDRYKGGYECESCKASRLAVWRRRNYEEAKAAAEADNLQRRRYAEAALAGWGEVHHGYAYTKGEAGDYGVTTMAQVCFDIADAMLAEQHRRESARGSE